MKIQYKDSTITNKIPLPPLSLCTIISPMSLSPIPTMTLIIPIARSEVECIWKSDRRQLSWFGHIVRREDHRLKKKRSLRKAS